MSKFRKLVEGILKEYYGKDDDDYINARYYSMHPDDHTTSGEEIEWQLDLPMNDEIRKILIDQVGVSEKDLQDDSGNWLSVSPEEVIIEYDIDGYPDDEYITVTNIYLGHSNYKYYGNGKYRQIEYVKFANITDLLPEDYLGKVSNELEDSGDIPLHHCD